MYAYSDKKDLHFHSYLSLFHAPLMELLIYNLFVRYRMQTGMPCIIQLIITITIKIIVVISSSDY